MSIRELTKVLAHWLATLAVGPALGSYAIRRRFLGADRALEGSTQALGLIPGLSGVYLRRAFLCRVLAHCDRTASVHFGTILSRVGTRLDANVYVGPHCHLGLVHLERNVMLASGVQVLGERSTGVTVGAGSWIASGAALLADVGSHSVVAAGAIVTDPVPEYVIAGGVPARILKHRRDQSAQP